MAFKGTLGRASPLQRLNQACCRLYSEAANKSCLPTPRIDFSFVTRSGSPLFLRLEELEPADFSTIPDDMVPPARELGIQIQEDC